MKVEELIEELERLNQGFANYPFTQQVIDKLRESVEILKPVLMQVLDKDYLICPICQKNGDVTGLIEHKPDCRAQAFLEK